MGVEILIDSWFKCYGQAWGNLCVPAAVAHPAKFSRKLIFRIFEHAIEEGWVKPGDTCIDCFGGVGLGALPAMMNGLHWVGTELEGRFCALAQANIDLWNKRYAAQMPNWGTAVIVQGDSRRLGEVLARARLCLSSPPWANTLGTVDGNEAFWQERERRWGSRVASPRRKEIDASTYGDDPQNLGNLPDTGFEAALAISSPAWMGSGVGGSGNVINANTQCVSRNRPESIGPGETARGLTYGSEPGQLAQMPEGNLVAVISSPPYIESLERSGESVEAVQGRMRQKGWSEKSVRKVTANSNDTQSGYGHEPGQLAALPEGDHAEACERPVCCVSSPPWEGNLDRASMPASFLKKAEAKHKRSYSQASFKDEDYGATAGQLGQETGSTFWAASRAILEEVYQVLAPGGHAIFVCKRFVRSKKIVDFPLQWARLCEAVGFTWIHHHKAWLVEDRGAQHTLEGGLETRTVKRFSFFKRLHAQKYPELEISWEDVLCFVK